MITKGHFVLEQPVGTDAESKLISILKILGESSEPLGSITIARELEKEGIFLSERAVRYHLKIADERGYTTPAGRDGRVITPEGMQEVKEALAPQHLGLVREKLETLAYLTTFDPEKRAGKLPINTSLIDKDKFKKALVAMKEVFKAHLCVSELVGMPGRRQAGLCYCASRKNRLGYRLRRRSHRSLSQSGYSDRLQVRRRP